MHIKQVIIQGFKSYKEQTVIEPFSPKHNVIVGHNGSGKSNFFAAIRFVLGDAYTQMSREERNALLHEGTGAAVMSAFVEIIFDNSDDRFPTGKPELILRRTIGMKKDEYSLDRKNATKTDVMNLLESAGFSRSNPYYIVPQGRVTALTNMKDQERLTLLKEVAGTQVYEARRAESLKIMQETTNKRDKIDELLDYIKERLGELEEEKEELRDYQEKDKDRRCLQYTLDHREQVAISSELENIDEQRETGANSTEDHSERFVQGEKDLAEVDEQISDLQQKVEFSKVDKRQFEDERRTTLKEKAKTELEVSRLADSQSAAQQGKAQRELEVQRVQSSITNHQQQLSQLLPAYETRRAEETRLQADLDNAEATRRRLFEKQGRNARFRNKKERDDHLREQVNLGYPQLAKVKAVRVQNAEDIAALDKDIADLESDITSVKSQLEGRGGNSDAVLKQIETVRAEKSQLDDQRKELWREDGKLAKILSDAEQKLRQAEHELSHTMDRDTSRGLASIQRMKRQYNIEGAYGTLADLMEVPDRFRRAVEATAGQSLFHYVVDNDDTATKLIELLTKERGGRVTFVCLNRLKPRVADLPNASDARAMIDQLEFEPVYERAFQQVFANTIICPNLTIAGQYARSHGVNGVTMDGDRSDNRGAFTGGSMDNKHSRLEAVRNVSKWRQECDIHRARFLEIRKSTERLDQGITQATGEIRKLEQTQQRQENSYGPLRLELRSKSAALEKKQDDVDAKRRAKANIESSMQSLSDQQDAFEKEINSPFKKDLTPDEETQLENLSSKVQDLKRQHSATSTSRNDLESRKNVLEIELRESLRPRLELLNSQDVEDSTGNSSRQSLKQTQAELKRIEKALDVTARQLLEADSAIESANNSIVELTAERNEILNSQNDIARAIEKAQKHMEKSIQKRRILIQRAAEVNQRIRELGILPQNALEKYEKTKSEAVGKRLHKVNDALKKYGHVNKKAFEQYQNFTNQRDTLTKRREELDSSQSSIEELINVLDQRKDEAIERTFKQVSREFANVFEKLVPAGRGRLVIQRRADRAAAPDESDDEGRASSSVENYTGVGISVSFNSKHDDQQRIQQLSGGQKSLCALTLVFAIQQCDPAPFYLFDEIDANLDAQYRTAVANMLKSISDQQSSQSQAQSQTQNNNNGGSEGIGGGQFICTTFRPEMLLVAEKCYGVRYLGNKSSSVGVVTREEALKFVEGEKGQ